MRLRLALLVECVHEAKAQACSRLPIVSVLAVAYSHGLGVDQVDHRREHT